MYHEPFFPFLTGEEREELPHQEIERWYPLLEIRDILFQVNDIWFLCMHFIYIQKERSMMHRHRNMSPKPINTQLLKKMLTRNVINKWINFFISLHLYGINLILCLILIFLVEIF